MTLASVVIDNYNYGRYLGAAIESALDQTYDPVEVIVVDDGSTDESRAVIERYADRVKPILKQNGGQGSAVNAGFAASRGEVVCFLDADDMLEPGAAERAVAALAAPGAAKAQWPLRIVDAAGHDTGRVRPDGPLAEGALGDLIASDGPDSYCAPPMSGSAYARWALEAILPMEERHYRRFADGYLSALAAVDGSVVAVEDPQGRYRVHGGNHSHGQFERVVEEGNSYFDALSEVLARACRRAGLEPDRERWRRRSFYPRLAATVEELDGVVAPGTPFVLIDDGVFGMQSSRRHRPLPLIERDGVDWGPPADDPAGIAALERRRAEGVAFVAFGWPAFWWREIYSGLAGHLDERYERVLDDDLLVVHDLRTAGD